MFLYLLRAFLAQIGRHSMLTTSDLRVGDRVELHPATDDWMRGDRYGVVERVGRVRLHVRMDRSGRLLRVLAANILKTIS